ncbi:YaiI/YqxD family protein [Caenispirillum salinarum]|uniref:YaiI/YqxD family protein n=1 Tax=Caenispirillum salinarum TaxID=859058 RepID=UPI00384D637F
MRVAERHKMPVHMVGNTWMRMDQSPLLNRVVVAEGADAADDWIAEHITAADICITADIPLAARCLEKGAQVIGSTGRPFTTASIGNALAMRDLMATLRETGEITGGPSGFTKADRSRFLQALEEAARKAGRGS